MYVVDMFFIFFKTKTKTNYIKGGNNPPGEREIYLIPGPPEAEFGARETIMEAKFSSITGSISEQSRQRQPLSYGESPPSTWDVALCTKKLVQISISEVRNTIQGKSVVLTELSFLVCELQVEKYMSQTR